MTNGQIITKRSPFVLIRTFIAIELLAFLSYFLVTGHGSYKSQIYTQLFFSKLLPYDAAKLLFLSGAQLLITIYAFINWYYESYNIKPGQLSYGRGVFFKKSKVLPLDKSMTVSVSSGPLGKLLHYGSIQIKNSTSATSFVLADISRPAELVRTLERCINPQSRSFTEPDISKLIKTNEHERLEFKSSLRFDHKNGNVNRELERAAMKTVAAFMNTKGGELILGVSDKREPMGLLADYQTLKRPDSDGFENHFTQVFNTMIGPEFRHFVRLRFRPFGQKDVCVIQVAPSARPVYLKIDDAEYFYVRTGNVTTPLKLSEVETYRHSRWPSRSTNSA
jgi:membrane protein YdbS with pleckstrin-like domain